MGNPGPSFTRERSAFFANRELNGEVLLGEVNRLRAGQVGQAHVADCAMMLRPLEGQRPSDAKSQLRLIAEGRFASQPAMGELLVFWAEKLFTDADVDELVHHVQRLAVASGALNAMWRTRQRLERGKAESS